ncbi:sugar ABC transporter ATP-binding protein [Lichenicoccus sp.]|uniref:sugar ABC transporter ATP-binding protein n=1 Tax=Lichenicoccus sp. TaxID=2781899 RepID=UPI003D143418
MSPPNQVLRDLAPAAQSVQPLGTDATAVVARNPDTPGARLRKRLLCVRNISKSFGGSKALSDVSFSLFQGEVLALLGENGAGKSTLIKILAGVHALEDGTILFEEQLVAGAMNKLPIAFIHQDLGLIEWMTVLENVCLTRGFARSRGLISWRKSRAAAVATLAALGLNIDPDTRVAQLGRTERSLVAIARALSTDAKVVVMDEPTASLPADEVVRLFAAVRMLRDRGVGVVYVSHRLEEIFSIADRVVVLRDGRMVGESDVAALSAETLIHMIIGRTTTGTIRAPAVADAPIAVEIEGAQIGEVGPVSLTIRAGEMLALTGLRGAGQDTIGRMLFGILPLEAGSVHIAGKAATLSDPASAMRQGIRFVSGDRLAESIVTGFSIRENFYLNPQAAGRHAFSRVRHGDEYAGARDMGRYVRLSPNDPAMRIEALSGGNQQKVVAGRWLHLRGQVLILEDPTAGVDVGAKGEIYRLLLAALQEGLAVVVISTDFLEVASLCPRAVVFSRGKIVGELAGAALTPGSLLNAASMAAAPNDMATKPHHPF